MNKQEYKLKAKEQIDTLFEKIDDIENKANALNKEISHKWQEGMAELKQGRQMLKSQYNQLTDAANEQWREVEDAFQKSKVKIENKIDELASIF